MPRILVRTSLLLRRCFAAPLSVSVTLVFWAAAVPAGDGVVALQTADPSCPDDSGDTYVDCGNGTVTDNRTGLVWLKNADCLGQGVTWYTAMEFVAGLKDISPTSPASTQDCGLSDGSSAGEWRLASVDELFHMFSDADGEAGELDCSPPLTNDQGTDCWSPSCVKAGFCSFFNVADGSYWSATTSTSFPGSAYVAPWNDGFPTVSTISKSGALSLPAWPVRGGQ